MAPSPPLPLSPSPPRPSLWRHGDFRRLWAAETISVFGSQVTLLALPLTAALLLAATPVQMGLLAAAETLPFLLIGLPAGAWVDRWRRRPVMVLADLGRALALLAIPAAWWLGALRIELLYAVGLATGLLTVFFDIAYMAYLPALVRREALVEGNSKLEVSRSTAQILGPGLAGGLVQLIGGPLAILIDAVSFALSALFLGLIRRPEPASQPAEQRGRLLAEIGDGLRLVLGTPVLRGIAGSIATSNFFSNVTFAVLVLFATRDLGLAPGLLGVLFGLGGGGALLGALVAARLAHRVGTGPTIIVALVVGSASWLLMPLAGFLPTAAMALLGTALAIGSAANSVFNITQVSLRQSITPDQLQGRMNATMRFIVWGTLPLGALLGGALGEWLGLRTALIIGAAGSLLAFFWLWFSPLRGPEYQARQAG